MDVAYDRERDFRTRSYLGPGVEGYPDKFPIFVRRRLRGWASLPPKPPLPVGRYRGLQYLGDRRWI